jgi:hypothetical protein
MWVAGGTAGGRIYYSSNGTSWTPCTSVPTFTDVNSVAWNGMMWIAVGAGSTNMAYSYDGLIWEGINVDIFNQGDRIINSITWNGMIWFAGAAANNTLGYSYNGLNWVSVTNSPFNSAVNGIAFNYRRPYTLTFPTNSNVATIGSISGATFPISISQNSQLDICSDAYYNSGYTNFSMLVRGQYS